MQCCNASIKWTCKPPGGFYGGMWERKIHTVRDVLFNPIEHQRLDGDGLQILLCEAESIINGEAYNQGVLTRLTTCF